MRIGKLGIFGTMTLTYEVAQRQPRRRLRAASHTCPEPDPGCTFIEQFWIGNECWCSYQCEAGLQARRCIH